MFLSSLALLWTIVTIVTVVPVMSTSDFRQKLCRTEKQFDSFQRLKVKPFHLYVFHEIDSREEVFLPSVSRYDSISGKWQSNNRTLYDRRNTCSAVVGSKVYMFGGYEGYYSPIARSEVYDILTDSFKILRPMPKPRGSCGAAVLGDYIFVAGGRNGRYGSSSVFRYNIKTDQWSTVSSMNNQRDNCRLVELNSRLYAISVNGSRDVKNPIEMYDPIGDQWSPVGESGYRLRNGGSPMAVTVHQGKIYVMDGYCFSVYSPETDEWGIVKKPYEKMHLDIVVLWSMNDKLWLLGSVHRSVYQFNDSWGRSTLAYSYDTENKQWTREPEADRPRSVHLAFAVNF